MSDAERPDVRELVGKALLSSHLEEHEGRIGAVHRIGALAATPRLGSAAWRFKFAHDASSYDQALGILVWRVRQKLHLHQTKPQHWDQGRWDRHDRRVRAACAQAVREWMAPGCERCGGTGKRAASAMTVARRIGRGTRAPLEPCGDCLGSGERTWTDIERAKELRMGLEAFRRGPMIQWIDRAGKILRGADRASGAIVRRELGMRAA